MLTEGIARCVSAARFGAASLPTARKMINASGLLPGATYGSQTLSPTIAKVIDIIVEKRTLPRRFALQFQKPYIPRKSPLAKGISVGQYGCAMPSY